MTLRFLRFGFDVAIWPFLLSLITLIPVFQTSSDSDGFFSTTVLSLNEGSARHWIVVFSAYFQFCYVLRRLWIEWELFLPLRSDFLENGDFEKGKYQEQFKKTCIVEYITRSHRRDKEIYGYFNSLFPGQVRRAEVLLNREPLRSLIRKRLKHITCFEDAYAKKVHQRANYLRELETAKEGGIARRYYRGKSTPRAPGETMITVVHKVHREDTGNAFFRSKTYMVSDSRTYETLVWHHQ
jgi:hypothetical protein